MEPVSSKAQEIADETQAMLPLRDFVRTRMGHASRIFAGAPFVLLALAPLLAFSPEAVMRSFVLTTMAVFTVHMPVVAGIYGLHGDEKPDAPWPVAAYLWLLLLWAATNWALCLLWR